MYGPLDAPSRRAVPGGNHLCLQRASKEAVTRQLGSKLPQALGFFNRAAVLAVLPDERLDGYTNRRATRINSAMDLRRAIASAL
jgi:hypothetical protein